MTTCLFLAILLVVSFYRDELLKTPTIVPYFKGIEIKCQLKDTNTIWPPMHKIGYLFESASYSIPHDRLMATNDIHFNLGYPFNITTNPKDFAFFELIVEDMVVDWNSRTNLCRVESKSGRWYSLNKKKWFVTKDKLKHGIAIDQRGIYALCYERK